METKNLLNKKITQWLLLVAMLLGCSANAWAWSFTHDVYFYDASNWVNGTCTGIKLNVKGNGWENDETMSHLGNNVYRYKTSSYNSISSFEFHSWSSSAKWCGSYSGAKGKDINSDDACCYYSNDGSWWIPPVWSLSIKNNGTKTYGGTGTSGDPYHVKAGTVKVAQDYVGNATGTGVHYQWKSTGEWSAITKDYTSDEFTISAGSTVWSQSKGYSERSSNVSSIACASNMLYFKADVYSLTVKAYYKNGSSYVAGDTGGTVKIGSGTGGASASGSYYGSVTVTATKKNGYKFIGWNTSSDGTGTQKSTDASYTFTLDKGTTLYALFEVDCATPTKVAVTINSSTSATICSGNTATISTASSQSGYKYQLINSSSEVVSTVDGKSDGSAVSFSVGTADNAYKVHAYLNGDEGCAADMSNTVKLSVDATSAATSVSGEGAVCSDKTKTLTIASGYKGSLQWQKSDAEDGTYSNISGKTSTTYITTAGEAGWYRVSVKNGVCDAAYTTPVQVTVDTKPTLGTISGAGSVCTGDTKTLTLNNHTQTINWQKSASQSGTYTTIPNTTGLTSYGATEAGWYRVQATNGVCDAVNNTGVQVTVDQPTVAGSITGAGDICNGGTKTLSSSGATATNYKWKSCSTESGTYVDASGTINLSTYSAQPTESTYYKLAVKNGECGWEYTEPVRVVVNNKPAQPGVITEGTPAPCINATGLTYSITAVATATGYTWTLPDGWSITSGAGTLSMTATAGTAGGSIKVTANNDCGSSAEQTLAVTVKGKAITVSPTTVSAKKYTPTDITATTDGDVTWAVTGTNNYLLNADNTVYTSGNVKQVTVKAVSDGTVTATTTNDGCETSATVTLSPSDDTETCN